MKQEYVYGVHAATLLLKQNPELIAELFWQNLKNDNVYKLVKFAEQHGVLVKQLTRVELDELTGTSKHQGVVASIIKSAEPKSEKELISIFNDAAMPLTFLILDGVQDPHNLGACLRSADATQVSALIIPKDNAVSLTATVRKVASGAAETVPLIQVTNLVRTIKMLQERKVWVYGAMHDASQSIYEFKFAGSVAVVMGGEGAGMRRLTRESCDFLFKIPMLGSVPNLNVSVATGVCLYEIMRQRNIN
jgi:23S rRNA (guanosine2251-2'-O)-methyltransferase